MEGGVAGTCFSLFGLVPAAEEVDDGDDRLQRTLQVEQFLHFHVCPLQPYSRHALSHVEEVVQREIILFLLYPAELPCLLQPCVHLSGIRRKGHGVYLFLAQRRQATFPQERAHLRETDFLLEVLGVYHRSLFILSFAGKTHQCGLSEKPGPPMTFF